MLVVVRFISKNKKETSARESCARYNYVRERMFKGCRSPAKKQTEGISSGPCRLSQRLRNARHVVPTTSLVIL